LSTLKEGLRHGGGVSSSFSPATWCDGCDNSLYWARWFYDLTFFIFINMLFIQIIFGIILDTFGELRSKRDDLLGEIQEKCFICGLARAVID